jgi:DNA-binding response OmpR family regulator
VLVVSGFSEQQAMEPFRGDAAADFLSKPFNPEQLGAKMHALLATPPAAENAGEVTAMRFQPRLMRDEIEGPAPH